MLLLNKIFNPWIKIMYKFFESNRYEREDLQVKLEYLLYNDFELNEEQYNKLRNIIHYGGYLVLHDCDESFQPYYKEASIYQKIADFNFKKKDVNSIYEELKKYICKNI